MCCSRPGHHPVSSSICFLRSALDASGCLRMPQAGVAWLVLCCRHRLLVVPAPPFGCCWSLLPVSAVASAGKMRTRSQAQDLKRGACGAHHDRNLLRAGERFLGFHCWLMLLWLIDAVCIASGRDMDEDEDEDEEPSISQCWRDLTARLQGRPPGAAQPPRPRQYDMVEHFWRDIGGEQPADTAQQAPPSSPHCGHGSTPDTGAAVGVGRKGESSPTHARRVVT